jgi:hypothetical protein
MSEQMAGRILREYFPFVGSDDPVSYFHRAGDAAEALKYSRLFWPELIEYCGAVFLALGENDRVEIVRCLAEFMGQERPEWRVRSWKDVVDSYNLIEIANLFDRIREPVGYAESVCRELGNTLMRAWRSRLLQEYPDRLFSVRLVEPEQDWPELRIEVKQEAPKLEVPPGWNE